MSCEVVLTAFCVDEQEKNDRPTVVTIIDDSGAPSFPLTPCREPDFSQATSLLNYDSRFRVIEEHVLEFLVFFTREQSVCLTGEDAGFDELHQPNLARPGSSGTSLAYSMFAEPSESLSNACGQPVSTWSHIRCWCRALNSRRN